MRQFLASGIILCSTLVCSHRSDLVRAADFEWRASPDQQYETAGTVYLNGEIKTGDHLKLLAAIGEHEGEKGMPLYVQLNSEGGNFEEALKISQLMNEKNLSSKLGPNARCLSACAIIFMSGRSFNNSWSTKERIMHPTAILGFHAPSVSAAGAGNFDAADLDSAYSHAVEQIGKDLMATARYRDEAWTNPTIKPGLINEMMMRNGSNFYFIDTVGKAAEFEIELFDALGPGKKSSAHMANACANAISSIADETVAADARSFWLSGSAQSRVDPQTHETVYTFEVNRAKGRYCDVFPRDVTTDDVPESKVLVGTGGAGQHLEVPDWFFWPENTPLTSVPVKGGQRVEKRP